MCRKSTNPPHNLVLSFVTNTRYEMGKFKYKQAIVPLFGIFISIFPSLIIVPMEEAFGEGDHLSFGHVLVAFILMVCCSYSVLLSLNQILKKRRVNALVQSSLCVVQVILILNHIGLI